MAKTKTEANNYALDHIRSCWDQSEDATNHQRSVWDALWDAYECRQDNSKKQSWQSRLYLPKVWMHVERSSAEVRRAMLQLTKLFKLKLNEADERGKQSAIRRQMARTVAAQELAALSQQLQTINLDLGDQRAQMALDEQRFKDDLETTNIGIAYGVHIKVAFLLGMGVLKIGWDGGRGRTTYRNIDIYNYGCDPDWTPDSDTPPSYEIERATVRLPDLIRTANAINETAGKKIYDLDAIKQIKSDYVSEDDRDAEARAGISPHMRVGKKVELKYFWGKIPNQDGTEWEDEGLYVVANGRYIIRRSPNPFNHGLAPYVKTFPVLHPNRGISGTSLMKPVVPLNLASNNLFNLTIDNMAFIVNKMFQVDTTRLDDPRNLGAIYPGRIWKTRPGQSNMPVVSDLQFSADGILAAMRMQEAISREIQEADSVTEFLQGMPSGGKKTATEIEIKTMESRGLFEVISRECDEYSLRPILEQSWDLYEQFGGYPSRAGKYILRVGGVSMLMSQQKQLEAINQVIGIVLKAPDMFAAQTDLALLWRMLLSVNNLSDAYKEPDQGMEPLTMEQRNSIGAQASADAQRDVANMSPEDLRRALAGMQQPSPTGQPPQ